MDGDLKVFVLLIVMVSTAGWLVNNWIRARHGYALENEWGGQSELPDTGENTRLRAENRELNDKLDSMQDRMVVLEKIVTDRGYSLSNEIEALRDTPARDVSTRAADTGAALNIGEKETQS